LFVKRSYLGSAINQAKEESLKAYRRRQNMIDIHNNILDKLLKSSGLQRDIVDGDGNWVFSNLY